jgi:uncharacterized protein
MASALITGATAGLGLGYAEAYARRGCDLVLVARDEKRLATVAADLTRQHGVAVEVLPADLAERAGVDAVAERLADPVRPVSALINNAGFGLRQSFLTASVDDEQRMLDVMVSAVMRLSHAVLPGMVERNAGTIINVSSMAGWFPGGTYSSAKAWVTSFSESLSVGLRGTGVQVIAVCPGFIRTEFHERAGMDMSRTPDWMWLDVSTVVDRTFRDLARGRPVSVAGHRYRMFARLLQHGPRTLARRFAGARYRLSRRAD